MPEGDKTRRNSNHRCAVAMRLWCWRFGFVVVDDCCYGPECRGRPIRSSIGVSPCTLLSLRWTIVQMHFDHERTGRWSMSTRRQQYCPSSSTTTTTLWTPMMLFLLLPNLGRNNTEMTQPSQLPRRPHKRRSLEWPVVVVVVFFVGGSLFLSKIRSHNVRSNCKSRCALLSLSCSSSFFAISFLVFNETYGKLERPLTTTTTGPLCFLLTGTVVRSDTRP